MSDHDKHAAPPEEPRTPMWLPAVGAVLFLLVGIYWAATSSSDPPPSGDTAADAGPG